VASEPKVIEQVSEDQPDSKSWLSRIPRWLHPNLTLPETGCIMAIWIAMQMFGQVPIRTPYSALYMLGTLFLILLWRNIAVITAVVLSVNIFLRIAYPVSSWADQHWLQWYCISSLATGHNIMLRSPWAGMSMAAYLPTGDLFGGLLIALGIQKYWYVWQVIDPLLFMLPVVMAPCATTLAIFLGMVWYWPFADYTNAGGNLEIELAILIAAIVAFRYGRKTAAIVFFAFGAMMRQPDIVIIPFVFILLWQHRDYSRMKLFAALLFLFGGVYILLDPKGAYIYEYRIYDAFQQSFYNANQGLLGNYSISSIPQAFGIKDNLAWNEWKGIYLPITAAGLLALLIVAWRARTRDTVLFLLVLAPAFVYILARGYAQLHYVVATMFPFFALAGPSESPRRQFDRYFTRGLAFVLLWFGLSPLAIFAVGKTTDIVQNLQHREAVPITHTLLLGADGFNAEFPNMDGTDAHSQLRWLNQGLEFDFASPVFLTSMRLTSDHVQIQRVKGIDIWWANAPESRGMIWKGTVEYSHDGKHFDAPREFRNTLNYTAFPVTIDLPRADQTVQAIRLRAKELYLGQDQWILGNIEFFGRR
jgi:hypothetical protein